MTYMTEKEPVNKSEEEINVDMKYPIYVDIDYKNIEEKCKFVSVKRTCQICGKEYTQSNKFNHERTQHHILYAKFNDKLRKLLLSA